MARRRIVLVFVLAILLPALVVGYLSLRGFAERREATRRPVALATSRYRRTVLGSSPSCAATGLVGRPSREPGWRRF
jgi:hypothetical protein